MTSSASTLSKVELQGAGDHPGTWHTYLNDALSQHEEDFRGSTSVAVAAANVTLTDTQYVSNQARQAVVVLTGTVSASLAVITPDRAKLYVVKVEAGINAGQTLTWKPSGGTGVTLLAATTYIIRMDGAGSCTTVASNSQVNRQNPASFFLGLMV